MKMDSAKLKILTLRVRITVFEMTITLMKLKHGCMGIGFIAQFMVSLAMK